MDGWHSYKEYSYSQGKFIPIHFDKQILPGTFEYTLNYLEVVPLFQQQALFAFTG